MGRVKFNVNTEYAYLANFKILQSTSPPLIRILNASDLIIHPRRIRQTWHRPTSPRRIPHKMQDAG